jgi:tetratricopeptide (TPR) repeat protein
MQLPRRYPPPVLETHLAHWVLRQAEEQGASWVWQELSALTHLFERWKTADPVLAVRIALAMEPVLVEKGWASLHQDLLDTAVSLSANTPDMEARIRATRASAHRASGRWAEAQADLDALLSTELPQADRARALQGLGELHWDQDSPEEACAAWEEARALLEARQAPDAGLLTMLASGLHAQGDDHEAARAADEAIAAAEAADQISAAVRARTVRGRLYLDSGQVDQAARVLEPALAAAMDAQDGRQAALVRGQLAEVALLQDRPETALRMYEQSASVLAQAGHRALVAQMFLAIGRVHIVWEQHEDASTALERALTICRELSRGDIEAQVLTQQGILARAIGDIDGALDAFAGALGLARDQDDPTVQGFVLSHRAAVEAAWDRLDAATQMLNDASECLAQSGDTLYQVILDVLGGFADLGRARDAAASDDAAAETAHIGEAVNRLARGTSHCSRVTPPRGGEGPHRIGDLRVALRLLDSALSELPPRELPPE